MANNTGSYSISTLLAARFQSAAEFGLSTIEQVLNADIAAHNAIVSEMMGELCETTTDRQRIYGSSADGEMIEVDEFGKAPTQMSKPGSTVGFPLRSFQFNLGWTDKWLKTRTPADMAIAVQSGEQAHLRAIQRDVKRAVYLSANYTYTDRLVDNVDLAVKRLVNADSAKIPNGPNGETYDGATHTHYTAESGLTATNLTVAINTVIEHGHGGAVKVAIARADEATVRALTGFVAYLDARVIAATSEQSAQGRLDVSRLDNRAIGVFAGAEVWVKPWAIQYYAFIYDSSSPAKTLALRQRAAKSVQGLRIASQLDDHPLYAQIMEAEFGIGVWTRTNGAVHFFNGGAYTDPTIQTY